MTTLVNNYDENVECESIEAIIEFFSENSANADKVLVQVSQQLDKEFLSWVKFTYCSQPRTEEQWVAAEQEFLSENYKTMKNVEQGFNLEWPHKIDEEELA